ncbi:hypothetical protein ES703_99127 [subsurface metagenome]
MSKKGRPDPKARPGATRRYRVAGFKTIRSILERVCFCQKEGKMFLGGSINLSGPDFDKKEITFESDISAEFYLFTKKGTKASIDDFDINVQIDQDKEVIMSTDIEIPEKQEVFCDSIVIGIESKGAGSLGLSLSIAQVCALIQILERYRECYYGIKALATERVVKSG